MENQRLPFVVMKYEGDNSYNDVFELAIKPAIKEVLNLSDQQLLNIRSDSASMYGEEAAHGLPDIPDRVLSDIQESLFVVCDTTGNSPNCYFELGYAVAHRKHIFLIHRRGSEPPPFDIRGRQILFYSGILELKQKLQALISHHYGKDDDRRPKELATFFERCNLPLLPLEGDGRYDYRYRDLHESPITIDMVTTKKFDFKEPWRKRFQVVLKKHLDLYSNRGGVLFNGDLVRLRDYHPGRDETNMLRFIRLEVEPTDYYSFISSNHCWNLIDSDQMNELLTHEKDSLYNLKKSLLANPLSVCVNVIINDDGREYCLIQERNSAKTFHGKQSFHCGAAGMVSLRRDMRSGGIDVFSAVKNELREELSLKVSDDDICFLGLFRETKFRDIALVAEVYIHGKVESILKPSADSFEVRRVYACDFSPEGFSNFLNTHGGLTNDNFAPLGAGAIIYSLIKRFPADRVENCLISSKNPRHR